MNSSPPLKTLIFEDARHAQAAEGWLVLGDLNEAAAELDQISPEGQKHPLVLEVQWRLHSAARNWDACLKISERLVELNPAESQHWILLAYAKRRSSTGGLEAAHEVLLNSQKNFPDEPLIAFNLACYNAQLGKLDLARDCLNSAFSLGNAINSSFEKELRAMSLEDPDLKPLRDARRQITKSSQTK